ncbi:restriction endonuclease subunit S [Clostridium sp. JN-1]|uniref:restriction endonuclease subunit S n=1 Tax=Clostridium sp. JN-1 TaxID=2483110 RepID=UPI000F0B201F|nr:restriction endonuclease subunit S [Clostridium sp. JN-1]
MDKNKANVPKIRFPGFTDPWEQRKLGEVLEIMTRTNNDGEYTRDDVLSVSDEYGVINQIKFQGRSFAAEDVTGYKKVVKGDIIYTRSPLAAKPFGIIKKVSNEEGIVSPLYIVNVPTEGNDSTFIYYNFDMPEKTNNYLRPLVRMGAKHTMNISNDEWLSGEIYVPSLAEQKKIGAYLAELDNLITLHQRKLNHLQDKKKSLLQKMFPKNGENFPKLRFPEFTDPWEQRKLGEISDKVTEKNTENFYDETLTNSAEFGIVTQRDFFDKDISNAKNLNGYYVVQNDDFVYNPRISNFAPVGPIKRNKLARTGVMSPLYYVFRTHDIDKTYLEHYFDTTCWHSFMKLNGDSGARSDRFAIKDSVFIEMPIPFPNLEEQKKIGRFFDTITTLITLHQRKLNHLQEQKKALLQQMFV